MKKIFLLMFFCTSVMCILAIQAQTARFYGTRLEYDYKASNGKGMIRFHYNVEVTNCKNHDLEIYMYVENPKGDFHKFANGKTMKSAPNNIHCSEDNQKFVNGALSIYHDALNPLPGKNIYNTRLYAWDNTLEKWIGYSDCLSYNLTGSSSNNQVNRQQSSSSQKQQSNRSQAQEQDNYSPDYSYMLTRYSEYDKIKEDFGSILRSAKEEYEMQTVYRFYYDSGWEKILSVSKRTCFSCGGDGKLHNWYAPFPPPSNICSNCKGTGRELPTVRARKENSPYMYMEDGERMYSNYNAGNYNNGSSGNSNNSKSSSSSSSNSLKRTTCSYCGGGGGCRSCNGRGYKYNSYSHHDDACPTCNGSGRCFNCRGTGRL